MSKQHVSRNARSTLALLLLVAAASAQTFTFAPTQIPQGNPFNNSKTENVDFADIDLDGDWDAAFADGGDSGSDQSRLWVNQGFAQGGTVGFFTDTTATQAPAVLSQARDIEFVDFDGDGDVDIAIANTSSISNQSDRWWTNMGGLQGGTIGFYQDQTSTRWIGLGATGSSVVPSLVLGSGGFADWSGDVDFGDLDDDGDLDLVHSSYGYAFSGNVPTRLFRNDGLGFFSEFNPSGFQLPGTIIANGNPGLWSAGVQEANTHDAGGAACDVATSGVDVEIGDIDGDLDLDLLLGALREPPRMFMNRSENGGVSTWLDVTALVYPPNYTLNQGHYANEFGDFDDDGDLDIYGMDWIVTFSKPQEYLDIVMKNGGNGVYGTPTVLTGSERDESEADFIDFDNDGDLDVIVANFSGQERSYRNTDGAGAYSFVTNVLPADGSWSLDTDSADVDNDGDSDVFVANFQTGQPNAFLMNIGNLPDTHSPRLYRLEHALDRVASATPTVVRVQVYDNAAYYTTWYDHAHLEVQVNAGPVTSYPMHCSQGQIFRGQIPGNLVGTISYRAFATDEHGNTGSTPRLSYEAINGPSVGTSFCSPANDIASSCPCFGSGQAADPGHGCGNSAFNGGAILSALGTTNPDTVQFTTSDMPAGVSSIYLQGSVDLATTSGPVAFGDGIRCAGGTLIRLGLKSDNDSDSTTTFGPSSNDAPISVIGGVSPGNSYVYQTYYRNPDATWCPSATFNVSNAIAITWL